jgi:WD40 repeat protein
MPSFTKLTLAWILQWDADWVTSVAFLGPTRRIAAGNNLGQILLWNLPDKPSGEAPKPALALAGHTNCVSKLAATPDGKTLISASYDHTVRYWDPSAPTAGSETVALNAQAIDDLKRRRSSKVPALVEATVEVVKPVRTLDAHQEWVVNLELSRDGKTLITGDDGGHVIVWDRGAANIVNRWKVTGWAYGLALSPDRKQACVGERFPLVFDSGRHAGLKLWDAETGKVFKDLASVFPKQYISAAAYSPDGKVLAVGRGGETGGNDGVVTLLDPATGKKLKALSPGHQYGITDLVFHPDGKHLASAGRDTLVRIWDIAAGKMVAEVGKPRGGQFKDWIHAVSWSADGNWLAAADMAGAVQVWTFG